jgi:hypothetical protein
MYPSESNQHLVRFLLAAIIQSFFASLCGISSSPWHAYTGLGEVMHIPYSGTLLFLWIY